RALVSLFGQAQPAEPAIDSSVNLRAIYPVEPGEESQVLPSGQAVVKTGLLGQQAHPLAQPVGVARRRESGHGGVAGVGSVEPGEHAQRGGLSRTVRSKQTEN